MWSRKNHFEIPRAPSELLLPSEDNLPRRAELVWLVSTLLSYYFSNVRRRHNDTLPQKHSGSM